MDSVGLCALLFVSEEQPFTTDFKRKLRKWAKPIISPYTIIIIIILSKVMKNNYVETQKDDSTIWTVKSRDYDLLFQVIVNYSD